MAYDDLADELDPFCHRHQPVSCVHFGDAAAAAGERSGRTSQRWKTYDLVWSMDWSGHAPLQPFCGWTSTHSVHNGSCKAGFTLYWGVEQLVTSANWRSVQISGNRSSCCWYG